MPNAVPVVVLDLISWLGTRESGALVVISLLVVAMLALDLCVFQRRAHIPSRGEALAWCAAWLALAVVFNFGVWALRGPGPAWQFFAGYLLELSLSADNLVLFALVFAAMAIPPCHQHRVLFWGILGALLTRAAFIFAGVELVSLFHWVLSLFGVFLVIAGARLFWQNPHFDLGHRRLLAAIRRIVPLAPDGQGAAFFVCSGGRILATPLFLALLMVEATDVVFALDSVPAVFAVTRDPFIIYTSNVAAVLGLRALYFVLVSGMSRIRYLRAGLAVVLVFLGAKLLVEPVIEVPILLAPATIVAILLVAVVASLLAEKSHAALPSPSTLPARSPASPHAQSDEAERSCSRPA
ncbi:MAG TPA: TerC/Alx family metal homeostasis membrane protein [Terriglobia bacterium]|nr:TerC/Alx family metal homeostasis membrane protein [Terriglobia bacterium]